MHSRMDAISVIDPDEERPKIPSPLIQVYSNVSCRDINCSHILSCRFALTDSEEYMASKEGSYEVCHKIIHQECDLNFPTDRFVVCRTLLDKSGYSHVPELISETDIQGYALYLDSHTYREEGFTVGMSFVWLPADLVRHEYWSVSIEGKAYSTNKNIIDKNLLGD